MTISNERVYSSKLKAPLGEAFIHDLVMKLGPRNSTVLIQIELGPPTIIFVNLNTCKMKLMHTCFKVHHHITILALLCANHLCVSIVLNVIYAI